MMKKSQIFLLLYCLILIIGGCTHNGGPSGDLYGRWLLERIDGENMEVPTQRGDLYWAFQKNVVQIQRDNGFHSMSRIYGTFRKDEEFLYLDFPIEEEDSPFAETGLGRQNKLQIQKMTSKEMVLIYRLETDKSLIYYFRKW